MLKRHVIVPVCIALVAGAFVAVSALVYLTGARRSLVKKKLKLGAILIYLTGLISCDLFDGKSPPTCYVPLPPPNEFHITEPAGGPNGIEIDLSESNVLRGVIERREGSEFSFRVEDQSAIEEQRDDLAALDGAFDEYAEEFEVALRGDLVTGEYFIRFFEGTASDQAAGDARLKASFPLIVTNGEMER